MFPPIITLRMGERWAMQLRPSLSNLINGLQTPLSSQQNRGKEDINRSKLNLQEFETLNYQAFRS